MNKQNKGTKNQHYVPEFYINNFALLRDSGKKEKYLISIYRFNANKYNELVPVKSICYEDYFYGKDGLKEKELGNKESKWSSNIKDIIEREHSIEEECKCLLKEFTIYQLLRTLGTFNYTSEVLTDIIASHLMENTTAISNDEMRVIVEDEFNGTVNGSDLLTTTEDLQ